MTYKKISFALFLALPFVAVADWWARYCYYPAQSSTIAYSTWQQYVSFDEAVNRAVYQLPIRSNKNLNSALGLQTNTSTILISNDVENTVYNLSQLTRASSLVSELRAVQTLWIQDHSLIYEYPFNQFTGVTNGNNVCWVTFNPEKYLSEIYQRASFVQLQSIIRALSTVDNIGSDVSALVPLVESNKNINAGIALDFRNATTNAQYQRSEIINDLTTIINNRLLNNTVDYDIPQIRDDIRALVSVNPSVPYSDNNALALEYFDLMGFDYSTDQAALVQAMINAGLATDNNDALAKLSSNTWRRNTLGPYVQAQRKKRDLIAQLRQSGITHSFDGRALDALANPELESLLQFSFNTPVSSNATLQAESLRHLDYIDQQTADSASRLEDIKQTLNGPLEVNVLNWPDDFFGSSISNAFDGLFTGLLEGVTNFNPHYNFDDTDFFSRNLYNWRGFGLSSLDQSEQNPVEPDEFIGVTTFSFSPTGDYFQDVPNLLAMQAMQGADLANIFASVAIHIQSNAVESANTDAQIEQYKEDLSEMANSALSEFEGLLHYSNLLQNVEFTDTKDILSLPEGFRTFEGEWEIPEYVNIQLPTWSFQDPSEEHRRSGENPQQAYTLTIDTAQYRQFFQNVRYVSLTLYWALGVLVIFFLFRLFKAFISWIPAGLTGEVPHDYSL